MSFVLFTVVLLSWVLQLVTGPVSHVIVTLEALVLLSFLCSIALHES